MRVTLTVAALLLAAATAAADVDEGLRRLANAEPATRIQGLGVLATARGGAGQARARRAVERALFDPEPAVRAGAVGVLVHWDARASGGEIVRLLSVERHPAVLPHALLALGQLHVQGSQPTLLRFASHPDARVRACVLSAAGELGGDGMRRLVLNALQMAGEEDPGWSVRAAAVMALARIGRAEDLEVVQRAYESGNGKAHWLARSALAKASAALHPAPRRVLESLLADEDGRVAVTAARGLADAGLASVLLAHLRDGRSGVRAAAVGGVRQANLRQATATLRLLARADRSRVVRWAAAETLFGWDDPVGDQVMLDAVRSREASIWTQAVARLVEKTGERHGRDVYAWKAALERLRAR